MFIRTKLSRPLGFARRPRPAVLPPSLPPVERTLLATFLLAFTLDLVAALADPSTAGSERRARRTALVPETGKPCAFSLRERKSNGQASL